MNKPIKTIEQHLDDLVYTERCVRIAGHNVCQWSTDTATRAAFKRADFIMGEVRHAAYFLADPGCPENLKQQARERLEQAIINCD